MPSVVVRFHTGVMPHHLRSSARPAFLARVLVGVAAVSAVGLAGTHPSAHAAGFAVTTTADGGAGSLRDAIDQANANPGPDTITVPAGTYTITLAGDDSANATGDFDILDDVTIIGDSAATTIIDGGGLDRVFDVIQGSATFQHVTVTGGLVPVGFPGGNIMGRPGSGNLTVQDSVVSNGKALTGGGIYSSNGVLTIQRSEILDNTAESAPGNGASGAAIVAQGQTAGGLVLTDSLVFGNNTDGNGIVYVNANATITNTTITGNSAYAHTVFFETYGSNTLSAHMVHATIASNTSIGNVSGLGIFVNVISPATMAVTVEGSLLVDNIVQGSPANCAVVNLGAIVSEGNNLTDDTSCTNFLQPSDQTNNNNALVTGLADNGGPTRTMALLTGSSAIDAAGNCGAATATDQRGVSRPQGPACDVGAYEADVVVPPSSTTTSDPGTTTTTDPGTTTTTDPGTTTTADPGTTTTTVAIDVTTTTDLGSGGGTTTTDPFGFFTTTTVFHGGLPATGTNPANSLWLAALVCSLGGLLILGARRLAR